MSPRKAAAAQRRAAGPSLEIAGGAKPRPHDAGARAALPPLPAFSAPPAARKAAPALVARVVFETAGLPPPIAAEVRRQWRRVAVAVVPTLGLADETLLVAAKPPDPPTAHGWAKRAGGAMRALVREHATAARIAPPPGLDAAFAGAFVEGLGRGLYAYDRYRSAPPPAGPRVVLDAPAGALRDAARRALPVVEGTWLARDLVNTPAEDMGPDELEQAARLVARRAGLRVRVLDARELARLGLRALLAVGRASPRAPRLVVLEHAGAGRRAPVLALAGKGVAFDTGGLNVKSAAGMELMKKDMGGAAAVLGVAWAVGRLAPKRNVRFYLALAENAIAGNALRPGDVLTALDGTTIEVGNTDAEGRLLLADTVALAVREGAARVVDAATLTGAALVALGRTRVPLLGNDDDLLAEVERCAERSGEKVWRLPSDPEYRDGFKSKIADLRNTGKGGEAGVMAGGLFIGHFAGRTPWAHLDISPASWSDAAHDLGPDGATGAMVATLARLALGA